MAYERFFWILFWRQLDEFNFPEAALVKLMAVGEASKSVGIIWVNLQTGNLASIAF